MKLKSIETFTTQDVGFVRVTSEEGAQGWGQVSTYIPTSPRRCCTGRWRPGRAARTPPISTICSIW